MYKAYTIDYSVESAWQRHNELGDTIVPGSTGDAPTPLSEFPPPELGEATWIEIVFLVATNDTMSQWIITFNQPGTCAYTADSGAMGTSSGDLVVGFVPV